MRVLAVELMINMTFYEIGVSLTYYVMIRLN